MSEPTPAPDSLAGIRDYEISVPLVHRETGNEQTAVARIPATSPDHAHTIAHTIADQLAAGLGAAPSLYAADIYRVTVTDVENTPGAAELAAGLAHFKRVVAALAAKFPGMMAITEAEYAGADPDDLRSHEVGKAIMFVTPRAYQARLDAKQSTVRQAPGVEPELRPVGVMRPPAGYGGHDDPDCRTTRPHHLARYLPRTVEVFLAGGWARLERATINHAGGTTALSVHGQDDIIVGHDTWITVRPATVESLGEDLEAARQDRRQMLTAEGWWNVGPAQFTGYESRNYLVMLERDGIVRQQTVGHDEPVLLRSTPLPRGWS